MNLRHSYKGAVATLVISCLLAYTSNLFYRNGSSVKRQSGVNTSSFRVKTFSKRRKNNVDRVVPPKHVSICLKNRILRKAIMYLYASFEKPTYVINCLGPSVQN